METIKGFVNHITYRNEHNGYTVLKLELENGKGLVTCTGQFPMVSEGELLEVTGDYTEHPTYGRQFAVSESRHCEPSDTLSTQRYLGSGAIKGLGPSLAGRIVEKFGDDTFRIIEDEPERLAEVKGISERMAQKIATQVEEQRDMRDAMMFLEQYGISNTLAAKIYEYYNQNVYQIIRENPYDLMEHVDGVGFARADEIARRVGFQVDSDRRIESGITYTLLESVQEGDIFMYLDELAFRVSQILGFEVPDLMHYLEDLTLQRKIKLEEEPAKDPEAPAGRIRVYTQKYYAMEINTARQLVDLSFFDSDLSEEELEKRIADCEKETGLTLNEDQRAAVAAAAKNGVFILTGGPGTGKTTTICVMIAYFMEEHMQVLLAAPTGRAAKRMSQATGYEAKTIHRLLEVSGDPGSGGTEAGPGGRGLTFARNRDNPLDTDVLIIDEMSMVDLDLMNALLDALEEGTRLVLVGDDSQLPSVGPGSVLKDVIASGYFPNVQLTTIYRQGAGSDIAKNASIINQGQMPDLREKSQDFFFVKKEDAQDLTQYLLHIVGEGVPRYLSVKPYDVQVLSPMHAGALGVDELNRKLQETLNLQDPRHPKQEREAGSRLFREGDKVMQIKNNYQLKWERKDARTDLTLEEGEGVFNGDMGIIRKIGPNEVIVEFDEEHFVTYSPELLDELELAYAITIHKAQGSEYPAVIIPLLDVPKPLMYRNLLYTAITRARRCVILLGSEDCMAQMVHNQKEHERNTSLSQRIQGLL